eukprot:scaffold16859_cov144-Skeletonema_dohrnii-CCMP3373.AAC.2
MEVAIPAAEHARRQDDDPSSHRRRLTTGPDYAPRTVVIVPIVDTEGIIRYISIRDAEGGRKINCIIHCVLPTNFSIIEWGQNTINPHLWPCAVALRVAEKKDKSYVCSSSSYYSEVRVIHYSDSERLASNSKMKKKLATSWSPKSSVAPPHRTVVFSVIVKCLVRRHNLCHSSLQPLEAGYRFILQSTQVIPLFCTYQKPFAKVRFERTKKLAAPPMRCTLRRSLVSVGE